MKKISYLAFFSFAAIVWLSLTVPAASQGVLPLPYIDSAADSGPLFWLTNTGIGPAIYGTGGSYGLFGQSDSGKGVAGASNSGFGVYGESMSSYGILGVSTSGPGVRGESSTDSGVHGQSNSGAGVSGYSTSGDGVHAGSDTGTGVAGYSNSGTAVYGRSESGLAGDFLGTVRMNGFLQPTGAQTGYVLTSDASGNGTWRPTPQGVPSGAILMWSGGLASIPSGWALCNGSNGTPDLRDRFVLSVSSGENPGATGGSSSHTHSFSASIGVVHDYTYDGDWFFFDYVKNVSNSVSGTTSSASNLPPYYKLAFIMKL